MGTSLTGVGKNSNSLNANKLQTLSKGIDEYLQIDGVTKKDLFFFKYNREILEENNVKGIWLQYFLKEWSFSGCSGGGPWGATLVQSMPPYPTVMMEKKL